MIRMMKPAERRRIRLSLDVFDGFGGICERVWGGVGDIGDWGNCGRDGIRTRNLVT